MKSILFIHRSVGQNLINDGQLRHLINATGQFTLSDYNQNTNTLTGADGTEQKMNFTFPGEDTRPQDLSVIFSKSSPEVYKPIRDKALQYNTLVVKSCYPNSNITSDSEPENIKHHYTAVCKFFVEHATNFVIITSPPLTPLTTNSANAARARQLTDWLANTNFGDNIKVFNLFDLLAAPASQKQANTLKKEYRR